MVQINTFSDCLVISIGSSLVLYNLRTGEEKQFHIKSLKPQLSKHEEAESSCNKLLQDSIACFHLSKDSRYMAAATMEKHLIVWDVSREEVVASSQLCKRPTSIKFVPDGSSLLVADKAGDVYDFSFLLDSGSSSRSMKPTISDSFQCLKKMRLTDKESSVSDDESHPVPIMGHFSVVTDMVVTHDQKYIITCDRDEKIRVSHYPNTYNIHTYCLGHQDFVTAIDVVKDTPYIVSGSGDGTLCLWNYETGVCVSCFKVTSICDFSKFLNCVESYTQNNGAVNDKSRESGRSYEELKTVFVPHNTNLVEIRLAIQKTLHCHSVAFICHRMPLIMVCDIRSECIQLKCSFTIDCPAVDLCWLDSCQLLVLLDPRGTAATEHLIPLTVLELSGESLVEKPDISHPCLALGNKFRKELLEPIPLPFDLQMLCKQKYDNMAEYRKLKEERIEKERTKKKKKNCDTAPEIIKIL